MELHEEVVSTPKALANFSPGLLQPWDSDLVLDLTLKGLVAHRPNAFSVGLAHKFKTQGWSLRSNPGLKLANAFGVK